MALGYQENDKANFINSNEISDQTSNATTEDNNYDDDNNDELENQDNNNSNNNSENIVGSTALITNGNNNNNNNNNNSNSSRNIVGLAGGGAYPKESFSIDTGMMWLLKSIERSTIQQHVCERILKLPHNDFQFYLPQIVHVCVVYNSEPIILMLLEKCKASIIIATQSFFLLQAIVHDNHPKTCNNAKNIWKRCEMASTGKIDQYDDSCSTTNQSSSSQSSLDDLFLDDKDDQFFIDEQYWSEKLKNNNNNNNTTSSTNNDISKSLSTLTPPHSPFSTSTSCFNNNNNNNSNTSNNNNSNDNISNCSSDSGRSKISFSTSDLPDKRVVVTKEKLPLASTSENAYSFFFDLLSKDDDEQEDTDDITEQQQQQQNEQIDDQYNMITEGNNNNNNDETLSSPTTKVLNRNNSNNELNKSLKTTTTTTTTTTTNTTTTTTNTPPLSASTNQQLQKQKNRKFLYRKFYSELHFIHILSKVGSFLLTIPVIADRNKLREMRNATLRMMLKQLNQQLFDNRNAIFLPVYPPFLVLSLCPDDAVCLNSRERVPFLMVLEVRKTNDIEIYNNLDPNFGNSNSNVNATTCTNGGSSNDLKIREIDDDDDDDDQDVTNNGDDEISELNKLFRKSSSSENISTEQDKRDRAKLIENVFGELWKHKENRARKQSIHSCIDGWGLISFIVKSGDDLRQEQLAMQLITQFHRIFKRSNIPLWLRPYLVIATGYDSGLIETIPDCVSLDNLKKKDTQFTTLLDYFNRAYGDQNSIEFIQAQTNFIESLAAYSLVCYLLQIKDRHNGNIMIDNKGHLIHIDYGFIMSISPGSMNFEKAPFKLTTEFVELMGGKDSDRFIYFTTLLTCGFIEVRRHYQEFLMMIELLLPYTNLTCINKVGESAITMFKERFKLELDDDQCQLYVKDLIEQSINSWTTSSYDAYQYYTNGINV